MSIISPNRLPQLSGRPFLTDGGLETCLIFHEGVDLPCFASIDLLRQTDGAEIMARYFAPYLAIARAHDAGFILESPTWRASPDWAEPLGLDQETLDQLNRQAIRLMHDLRAQHAGGPPIIVSGCIGPRGDGYRADAIMAVEAAEAYHRRQIALFAEEGVDMVTAMTMTNVPEAIGIVRAAVGAGVPVAIAFTVETDGRLPAGDELGEAIAGVDAATDSAAAYFMINCAHPDHFTPALAAGGDWLRRIRGLRVNASRRSHAELDESTELDIGDPVELGAQHRALVADLPALTILGGCCGTDHRHIAAIAEACLRAPS